MVERLDKGLDDLRALRARLLNRFEDGNDWCDRLLDGLDDLRDRIEVVSEHGSRPLAELAEHACAASPVGFLGVLRAGDELSLDALLELAVSSGMHRDCDLLYSDEQRV